MSTPRRVRWWMVAPVVVVLAAVGGTWVYIHVIEGDPPAKLTLQEADPSATTTSGTGSGTSSDATVDGDWSPTDASIAGYRVDEVLLGQSNEAVGRTNAVTGDLHISGTTVDTGSFTVDLTKVTSDESRRDGQFQGRVMDTADFPTATFELTAPITLDSLPSDLTEVTVSATGDLTLRGTTKSVTFDLTARRNGATIEVNGTIPITFADWGIPNPSTPLASTDDHGVLEFLLVFARAS